MKLCHVVPSLEQRHGGPSKSVRALCRALARAGHAVELLTTAPDAPAQGRVEREQTNLTIHTFRRDRPERFCLSAGLRTAVLATDADVIHHHALWLRTLHYAATASRRRNTPLVISPRGMMSHWAWHHHRLRKAFSASVVHPNALSGAAAWHATSPQERTEIQERGFTQPICVAPNGVDQPDPAELQAGIAYWRAACPDVIRRPTALFYGRFHEKKRVIELIDAWTEHASPEWLLLLVGLPETYTPAMLEQYALQISAAGRVRAFNGTGLPQPYGVASLFVLGSHNENFGLSIAEAMAHGVPAVVTDTTPWHEIQAKQCGWCVPWTEFGRALGSATRVGADELRARGAQAQAWVLQEYSWDRAAAVLTGFYATLNATGA